jgi:pimeloyl-ACP methyl ester carboxylesterase
MPWAPVNGIRLYYEVTGSGAPRGLAHTAREVPIKRPSIYALAPRLRQRQLRVPTLLIVGEHDEPCLETHRFMADCIKGTTHVMIRNVGHLTNLEAPAAFNAAVKRFLAR